MGLCIRRRWSDTKSEEGNGEDYTIREQVVKVNSLVLERKLLPII